MKKTVSSFAISTILPLLLMPCMTAHAQQAATGSKWVVASGRTLVQINSDGIHINQRDPKELTHFAIVSRHVTLPAGQPWKISFEVRFGELRTAGAAIGIFDGAHTLGWIGSDGWYKRTGCFIGKDDEAAQPPTDTNWHKFEFSSDGAKITISDNGVQVGAADQGGTPSLIKIGDIFDAIPPALPLPTSPPPGWQSEISVRNVVLQPSLVTPSAGKTGSVTDVTQNREKLGAAQKHRSVHNSGVHTLTASHKATKLKRHRLMTAERPPSDYLPVAEKSSQIAPSYSSPPSEELKRAVDDYQQQIIQIKFEKDSVVAHYDAAITQTQTDMAVGGQQGKIAIDEAKSMSATYLQHLRDLVTAFASIRAMPGYAEHYIETGWVYDAGSTEGIPGVSGLRNIMPR